MKIIPTPLKDLFIIEPAVFADNRGFFFESYNANKLQEAGLHYNFVQDNHSLSLKNVLRGLHYQIQEPQGKLVRAVSGEVLDIAVDIRRSSPTFGQWASCLLSAENKRQFWIPEGFAHGFVVLSDSAEFLYKTTNYYAPQYDRVILWNDPDLGVDWQLKGEPILSAKDQAGKRFKEADLFD